MLMNSSSWSGIGVAERQHEDAERRREEQLGDEVAAEQHGEPARGMQPAQDAERFVRQPEDPSDDEVPELRDDGDDGGGDRDADEDDHDEAERVARRVVEIDVERHRAEQQERHEQDRLDDEAADAVERAGGDGRARRNTLALEEPDVDRDARGGGRDREVDVGDRELQRVHGPERQRDRRRAERRHGLGDPRQLRHDQAEHHEPPRRVLQ